MATKFSARSTSPMHRPKLMRGSITEPSLATSNASRNDLASLDYPTSSATTLLARVASYSTAQHEMSIKRRSGEDSAYSSPSQSPRSDRKEPFEMCVSRSGNYFSFPSFEEFQEYLEGEDRKT